MAQRYQNISPAEPQKKSKKRYADKKGQPPLRTVFATHANGTRNTLQISAPSSR